MKRVAKKRKLDTPLGPLVSPVSTQRPEFPVIQPSVQQKEEMGDQGETVPSEQP